MFISRIFIADDLERLKTQQRWKDHPKQNLSSEEYLKRRMYLPTRIFGQRAGCGASVNSHQLLVNASVH
jgi:hypothetical protein